MNAVIPVFAFIICQQIFFVKKDEVISPCFLRIRITGL